MSSRSASRPHRAARVEDALDSRLATFLQYRGWTARVEPYVGYGAHPQESAARPVTAIRGWRSFAVVPAPFAEVQAGSTPGSASSATSTTR